MSRNVFCKFYLNDKFVKEVIIDKLKTITDNYTLEFDGDYNTNIDTSEDVLEYWGLVADELLIPDDDVYDVDENGDITFVKGAENKYTDITNTLKMEQIGNVGKKCFYFKKVNYRGSFYTAEIFARERDRYALKLKEERDALTRLQGLRDNISYYTLENEEKEELLQDIGWAEESVELYEDKIYMCQYMIDTLELIKDMFGSSWNDNIKVFIYVE